MAGGGHESWYTKSKILNKRQSSYNYTEINSENICTSIDFNYFWKMLYRRYLEELWLWPGFPVFQGSEYTTFLYIPGFWMYQSSEYTRILSIPLVLNMPAFWVYQGSSSEYASVLNIPRFWTCQVYTGLHMFLNKFLICLIMPE